MQFIPQATNQSNNSDSSGGSSLTSFLNLASGVTRVVGNLTSGSQPQRGAVDAPSYDNSGPLYSRSMNNALPPINGINSSGIGSGINYGTTLSGYGNYSSANLSGAGVSALDLPSRLQAAFPSADAATAAAIQTITKLVESGDLNETSPRQRRALQQFVSAHKEALPDVLSPKEYSKLDEIMGAVNEYGSSSRHNRSNLSARISDIGEKIGRGGDILRRIGGLFSNGRDS